MFATLSVVADLGAPTAGLGERHQGELWSRLDAASNVTLRFVTDHFFRRNGHSGQVVEEIEMLRGVVTSRLQNGRAVRTVCEVGFNAGHSATVWLHGLDTQLKTFDVFRLPYSNASREFIDQQYSGRVEFISGPSQRTVPHYIKRHRDGVAPACDVWFIDGDHSRTAPEEDLRNALLVASDDAVIIADDCTGRFPAVQRAWIKLLETGQIQDAWNRTLVAPPPGGVKGWCVGRFARGAWRGGGGAISTSIQGLARAAAVA